MLKRLSELVVRFRWPVVIIWVLLTAFVIWKAPVLSEVAKTDSKSFMPGDSDFNKASNLLQQLYPDQAGSSSLILTLQHKGGISKKDREYEKGLENYLKDNKDQYKIKDIISPFSRKEIEKTMISKNREVALVVVRLTTPGFKGITNEVVRSIRKTVQPKSKSGYNGAPIVPSGLKINVTGEAAIGQERTDAVQQSMAITGRITVILVAIILIIIYRSPVAPLVPLFTIGLSFMVSRGLVAGLTKLGLNVSSFTETFLIAILFGAGTDYCLLIISRFREEILSGKSVREALNTTLPHTGEAVLSSGGTVIIGFACMIFAKFGLFSTTGPSIAIGVAVTILAALTLVPALLSILGQRVFWPMYPSKNSLRENDGGRFWNKLSNAVTSKPLRFLAVSLIVLVPFLIMAKNVTRSFDQLADLPGKNDAVKGFKVLKNNFDQGELVPIRIVIKTSKNAWSNESLQTLDKIADNVSKIDHVARVRTATRPLGDKITEVGLPNQIKRFSDGLGQIGAGFEPIVKGLDIMKGGVEKVAGGMSDGGSKLSKLAQTTGQVEDGISKVRDGLGSLENGTGGVAYGLDQVNNGLNKLSVGVASSKQGVDQVNLLLQGVQEELESLVAQRPELASDPNFQKAYGTVKALQPNMNGISSGLGQVQGGFPGLQSGIGQAGEGLGQIKGGMDRSNTALGQIQSGLGAMRSGQLKAGKGLISASSGLNQITSGFGSSSAALLKMESGVSQARGYADEYTSPGNHLDGVFYLPPGTLEKYPQLRNAMEYYIAPGGKGAVLDVVLSTPPYTNKSLDTVSEIKRAVADTLKGTPLEKSEFYVGGGISSLSELRQITADDLIDVMIFVLAGVFLILVILLRSFIAPIYLLLTILLSFVTTMGITGLVFQVGLGHEGLDWSVPFFAFCLLVALGVDYNIFLMSRVKEEYKPGDVTGGVARALSSTGKIITSCGIIMAGTFGAMMASPLNSLVTLGFATVVGLLLDTFIIRSLLVPAIAVKVGELNWWPGRKVKIVPVEA